MKLVNVLQRHAHEKIFISVPEVERQFRNQVLLVLFASSLGSSFLVKDELELCVFNLEVRGTAQGDHNEDN